MICYLLDYRQQQTIVARDWRGRIACQKSYAVTEVEYGVGRCHQVRWIPLTRAVPNASEIVTNAHKQLESILADELAEKWRSALRLERSTRRQFGGVQLISSILVIE